MAGHIVAIATGIVGAVVSGGTWLIAQTTGGSSDFGPWAQAGGTATAVGALAYVAKLLADGRLVAQPIAELAQSAKARDDRWAERDRQWERMVEAANDREETLRLLLIHDQQNRKDRP